MRTVVLLPTPRELAACAAFLRAHPDVLAAWADAPPGLPGALGLLHEANLAAAGHSGRRALGRFYTPVALARAMVRRALGVRVTAYVRAAQAAARRGDLATVAAMHERLLALRVLDPAAGGGMFLLAALEWFVPAYRALDALGGLSPALPPAARALAHNLAGLDLDPQAAAVAVRSLTLAAAVLDGALPAVLPDVRVGDALPGAPAAVPGPSAVPEAPAVPGAAALVLGNPPWGGWLEPARVEVLSRTLGLPARNLNTFAAFVAQGVRLLAPGGALCFVVPKNLIKADGYRYLRTWLLAETELRHVADVGVFPGVTSEAVVLYLRRRPPEPAHRIRLQGWETPPHRLPQATVAALPSQIWPLHLTESRLRLLEQMRQASVHLEHLLTVARGEETGYPGLMARCPNCGAHRGRPKQLGRRPVQPCPACGESMDLARAPVHAVIADAPDSEHTEPILLGRDIEPYATVGHHWFDPAIPGRKAKPAALYAGPKLLVRKISHRLVAAPDSTDRRCTQGLYILRPQPGGNARPPGEPTPRSEDSTPQPSLAALCAWLNSDLLDAYYQMTYNLGAELTTNVVITHLRALPLPLATPATWAKLDALARTHIEGQPQPPAIEQAVARLYGLDAADHAALAAARQELYAHPPRTAPKPPATPGG